MGNLRIVPLLVVFNNGFETTDSIGWTIQAGLVPVDVRIIQVIPEPSADQPLLTRYVNTVSGTIEAMRKHARVVLVTNGGEITELAPLLMAVATMPHVHVVTVKPGAVTVLRAAAKDELEAALACTKAIETLAEERARRLKEVLRRTRILRSGRFLPPSVDAEALMRFQLAGDLKEHGLELHDWRGGKATPEHAENLALGLFASQFALGADMTIIVSEPPEGVTQVHLLDYARSPEG